MHHTFEYVIEDIVNEAKKKVFDDIEKLVDKHLTKMRPYLITKDVTMTDKIAKENNVEYRALKKRHLSPSK